MSPRIFFGVLSVIILGWAAAGAYVSSQQLEQPVFLDHYTDEYAQEGLQMQFYYITNKGDNNTINFITLGDIPGFVDGFHEMFTAGTPHVQQYGPHELRTVSVTMDFHEVRKLKEKTAFNEMTVYLSDGESFVADIGEVIIHPIEQTDNFYLSQMSSTVSEDWIASYYEAEESLSITGMTPHLPEALLPNLKVHLPQPEESVFNQNDYIQKLEEQLNDGKGDEFLNVEYPVSLDQGEGIAISLENKEDVKYVLNSWMMIEGEDQDGSAMEFPANLYHLPELNGANIKAIIEQKGGGIK